MKKNWAIDYIGKPWKGGARGPEEFDCWGLVVDVYKKYLNKKLPTFFNIHPKEKLKVCKTINQTLEPDTAEWIEIKDDLKSFDVVLMGRTSQFHHIGLIALIDSDYGVLHCMDNIGVIFSKSLFLKTFKYNHLRYFRLKE